MNSVTGTQKGRNQEQIEASVILLDDHGKQAEERARQREFQTREAGRAKRRGYRKEIPALTDEEQSEFTFVASRYEETGHFPNFNRKHNNRLDQMNRMHAIHGDLALLTLTHALRGLDDLPLRSDALANAARRLVDGFLPDVLTFTRSPRTVDVQRGEWDGTHAHLVLPLMFLRNEEAVRKARWGKSGGAAIAGGLAHAVAILNTAKDFKRVACYVSRHPDAILSDPDHPLFLHAAEEELQRLATGVKALQLGWKQHVPNRDHFNLAAN